MNDRQGQAAGLGAASAAPSVGKGKAKEGGRSAEFGIDAASLFRSERARLVSAVGRRVPDADEAADLVQEAFARLTQIDPLAPVRKPAAYLQRIVRNLLRDRAKRAERRYAFCELAAVEAELPATQPEQEWAIEAGDLMEQYVGALATLSPKTREVFLLHRVEELRYREIADRLGITVATVEYHMARALVQLDRVINQ